MEKEFFEEANTNLHWRRCFTKQEMSDIFQDLYLDAIRRISSQTKSDNPDTIYGTSPGFMQKLQQTFISDLEDINETTKNMTGKDINAYLLYLLEPQSIMDCFWLGHFVGAWTHHQFVNKGHFYQNGFHTNTDGTYTDE